ncbi:hypothetical protein [Frigoriglobus tundricola]|uniref:SMI1/KNR4 family protein n=1 Tax=Frigoriglobus tundricola TaxID=2774151 RepID=A0A6M5YPF1_9BACT|nr:hypothetical protein [Frigoriglobus tundricola]QJW95875.1 hypothetical protein FTUN_3429 [Frigoriglobus tundricola]
MRHPDQTGKALGSYLTEPEWLACADPNRMLRTLDAKEWKAALAAFAGACLSGHKSPGVDGGWNWTVRAATPAVQVQLLCCLVGNPFRPAVFSPEWRTGTALTLASQMYDSRDFSAMPILADALQDTGCDSASILDHCRGSGPHVRGCWVVDLVLGKE